MTSTDQILSIRESSRALVRELGFMNSTLADTQLSPSGVHAIVEIGAAQSLTASQLTDILLLEKSTVSRLVKSLITSGLLTESKSASDGRLKQLQLTSRGQKLLANITNYANTQVREALERLDHFGQNSIQQALSSYAWALKSRRTESDGNRIEIPEIQSGYQPGLFGQIIELHLSYYSALVGFGAKFETLLSQGISEFIPRLHHPENEVWSIHANGKLIASIAIDGQCLADNTAQLRWFIVAEQARGMGLGEKLLKTALNFCDAAEFRQIKLWTFEGLDAAQHLYQKHGFQCLERFESDRMGAVVREMVFTR